MTQNLNFISLSVYSDDHKSLQTIILRDQTYVQMGFHFTFGGKHWNKKYIMYGHEYESLLLPPKHMCPKIILLPMHLLYGH